MALTTTAGSLGAANANVAVDVEQNSTFSGVVTGTFVGTVTFQALYDPTEGWVSAQTFTRPGVSAAAALTAPGNRIINTGGAIAVRAAMTAYTSGTAVVTLAGTPAASGASSGGGGGGGAVTVADGADVAQGTTTDAGIITDTSGTVIGFLRGAILRWNTYLARIPAALTGSGNFKVALTESTASQAITAASLPLPTNAATDRTTAAAPASVELSDGAAFYTGAKTGQLPAALVSTRLDVNLGAAPATVTANATLQAGTAVAGNVGGLTKTVSSVLTRPANTTTYTANDEMTDTGGTIRTLTAMATATGGRGIITHCFYSCSSNGATKPTLTVFVYDTTSTPQTDNAAFAPSDGVQDTCLGSFTLTAAEVGDATSNTGNFSMDSGPIHIPYTTVGSADLYFRVKVTNGYTPGANSDTNTFRFKTQQDNN
jgi:hypothetical protein